MQKNDEAPNSNQHNLPYDTLMWSFDLPPSGIFVAHLPLLTILLASNSFVLVLPTPLHLHKMTRGWYKKGASSSTKRGCLSPDTRRSIPHAERVTHDAAMAYQHVSPFGLAGKFYSIGRRLSMHSIWWGWRDNVADPSHNILHPLHLVLSSSGNPVAHSFICGPSHEVKGWRLHDFCLQRL